MAVTLPQLLSGFKDGSHGVHLLPASDFQQAKQLIYI
jgi:hypothetical protein